MIGINLIEEIDLTAKTKCVDEESKHASSTTEQRSGEKKNRKKNKTLSRRRLYRAIAAIHDNGI